MKPGKRAHVKKIVAYCLQVVGIAGLIAACAFINAIFGVIMAAVLALVIGTLMESN